MHNSIFFHFLCHSLSGIYLHIPFCKQACYYCDFHFSTNSKRMQEMTEAISKEIMLQKDFLPSKKLNTIYFGGGTPSLLSQAQIDQLLKSIYQNLEVSQSAEITLEANPDDLSSNKLKELKKAGINRLSIGIQSFYEPHLQFMNRAHNSHEAESCVKMAQDIGIENISIDLIYGIPDQNSQNSHSIWEADMAKALSLQPKHISAYCLTIEPQTVFGKWEKQNKLPKIEEEFAAQQFEMLISFLDQNGFEQYEISNFGLPNYHSKHNTSYWQQKPYLGVGPSAHSFNGKNRYANIRNNAIYLRSIGQNKVPSEEEILSKDDNINEYILTSLRTKWGTDLSYLQNAFNLDLNKKKADEIYFQIKQGTLLLDSGKLKLTKEGKLLADYIAQKLFI